MIRAMLGEQKGAPVAAAAAKGSGASASAGLPPIPAAWAPVIILSIVVGSFGFHHEAGAAPIAPLTTDGQAGTPSEEPNFDVIQDAGRDKSDG